jgi:hypothetical protein
MELSYPNDRIFDEITVSNFHDFPVLESCLTTLISCATKSREHDIIRFSDVFTEDLEIVNGEWTNLNPFLKQFKVCDKDIISIMMVYLSKKSKTMFKTIYKFRGLSQSCLAWCIYHGVDRERINDTCIGFVGKRNDGECCIICMATVNVITQYVDTSVINYSQLNSDKLMAGFEGKVKITISPLIYTGNRHHMSITATNCHFVVWSFKHDSEDFLLLRQPLESYFFNLQNGGALFYHTLFQYGHPHMHFISGTYFDIRAKEIFDKGVKCINNDESFGSDEFYHPIDKYYSHCSATGKDYIACALMIMKLRVKCNGDALYFYKYAYGKMYSHIKCKLEYPGINMTFGKEELSTSESSDSDNFDDDNM